MQDNKYILAKSFVLHKDSLNILDELTDDEAGKLIKAIYKYQVTGEIEKLERGLNFIFTGFVNQFKRDQEKYIHKCEVNKGNRLKQSSGVVTNGDESSGVVTNGTDKDSKKDNDSDNEKDSKTNNDNKKVNVLSSSECKKIISSYSGFNSFEIESLHQWIDHKYDDKKEKYKEKGLKNILAECLSESNNDRDICYVIKKSMTSGKDGMGWSGIGFKHVEVKAKPKQLEPVKQEDFTHMTPEQQKHYDEASKKLFNKLATLKRLKAEKQEIDNCGLPSLEEFSR